MQLAFWSNFHGQTATTTSMAVMASTIAMKYPLKILMAQVHSANDALEKCFFSDFESKRNQSMVESNGIDALIRMVKNGKLTPEQIVNYTLPIMKDSRLDLLIGTGNPDEKLFYENAEEITRILKLASKTYDLVLIDTPSGLSNPISHDVLMHATGVVVCLNQNKSVLENFDELKEYESLRVRNPLICLGRYDQHLSLSANNIKRRFGFKEVVGIPQSSDIQEAINNHTLLHYIGRQIEERRKDHHHFFMKTSLDSSNKLLKYFSVVK